ncbi:hypothetical protein AAFF_G00434220 [Aldrovandia affinis]|uniref:Uncharacterized protein n=1 Tax=Aldrovandia affinis TaxID=143900 RepID=A0AAD7S895_9TELE|nr:hypothetical protein AAFF_G00434220 [Aldrovandia affinis]
MGFSVILSFCVLGRRVKRSVRRGPRGVNLPVTEVRITLTRGAQQTGIHTVFAPCPSPGGVPRDLNAEAIGHNKADGKQESVTQPDSAARGARARTLLCPGGEMHSSPNASRPQSFLVFPNCYAVTHA